MVMRDEDSPREKDPTLIPFGVACDIKYLVAFVQLHIIDCKKRDASIMFTGLDKAAFDKFYISGHYSLYEKVEDFRRELRNELREFVCLQQSPAPAPPAPAPAPPANPAPYFNRPNRSEAAEFKKGIKKDADAYDFDAWANHSRPTL